MKTKYTLYIIALFFSRQLFAQTTDDILNLLIQKGAISQNDADSLRAENAIKEQDQIKDKTFKIDAELRTRSEYRDGYRNLRNDTTVPAFFTNQRTRLLFTYEVRNRFIFHTSLQDVRLWGQYDARSNNATVQVFEAFGEIFINLNLSVKLGRQKIALDNQRLFAENDWRANAGSHDAVRLGYYNEKLTTELYLAF
ncbi:MAG: alginate export family protein, partial [Bacteroidota bacterium]